jgi:ABC-type multidrug transport system fused ATPase/permease subunit
LQKFLLIQPVVRKIRNTKDLSIALHLENVDFSWEPLPDVLSDAKIEQGDQKITGIPAVLHKISMQVKTGTLVGLCGSVGCGKSSLFYGLLGQIYSNGGKFTMRGRLAYVSQQAWLVNDTVQENICFGEPYDYERYHKVVSVCHLIYDFAILPDGDQCVVGERGSTLSGGQRQRICLARAVYSNRDIFLLDDPLSSVDATVGAAIFEDCIMKYLRANGKTVLFISGQIQLLEQCDMVHVLKTGRIVQSGTHLHLISKKKGEYWEMVDAGKKEKNGLEEVVQGNRTDILQPIVQTTQVVVEEEKKKSSTSDLDDSSKGAMGIETYQRYTQAAGGAKVTVAVLLVFALNMGLNTFSSWWLSYWFNHGSTVGYNDHILSLS